MDELVYEAPELMNVSASPQYNAALPLGPPSGPADTQALQLGTNGDLLYGRADNGAPGVLSQCVPGACISQ